MDLFENEELLKPKKKFKIKASTVLMVIIVMLILLCFIILGLIAYFKETILTITLDAKDASDLKSIFIIEEEDKIYIPIRRMAEYLEYETYNGDYITLSEDTNKCYIMNSDELVSFTLNSNVLTKVRGEETEKVKISEPITQINGELCITSDGAEDAFNFRLAFNKEKNQITIETLSYLYTLYLNHYVSKGYSPITNETFENKMAIFDNLLIVKGTNEHYGVITGDGEVVLETKYESIKYLRKTSDFLVSSNDKVGIISRDKSTKVSVAYDSIESFTSQNNTFYIVESSNRYGLLDANGNVIIYPEYSGIGMNVSQYSENGVTSGYIFYDELIPVVNNNKWALFNVNGQKITDFIYDGFGCQAKTTNTYGVLQIQDYNLIVVRQGEKYDLITADGNGLFKNFILDSVYMLVTSGKTNYYISYGEQQIELLGFLEENGIKKVTN